MEYRLTLFMVALLSGAIGCRQNSSQVDTDSGQASARFNVADRLDIENVVASAFISLDSFDLDAWSDSFTDTAVFVVIDAEDRFELDRSQLEGGMRARFKAFRAEGKQRRHVVTNIAFLSQTEATAHLKGNGVVFSTQDHGQTEIVSTIYLEGWLEKSEGVWRINKWVVGNDARMNTRSAVENSGVHPSKTDDG